MERGRQFVQGLGVNECIESREGVLLLQRVTWHAGNWPEFAASRGCCLKGDIVIVQDGIGTHKRVFVRGWSNGVNIVRPRWMVMLLLRMMMVIHRGILAGIIVVSLLRKSPEIQQFVLFTRITVNISINFHIRVILRMILVDIVAARSPIKFFMRLNFLQNFAPTIYETLQVH